MVVTFKIPKKNVNLNCHRLTHSINKKNEYRNMTSFHQILKTTKY